MHDGEELLTAFTTLLPTVAPERRDQALRVAIRVLVSDGRTRLGNRSPVVNDHDKVRWAPLKLRLREHIAGAKIPMSAVAEAVHLPLSTVQRSLSPNGPAPGRAIADLLEGWLDQSVGSIRHIDAPPEPARAGNGASHTRVGLLPTNRLDHNEAGKLRAHLSHMSERDVRTQLGMSLELAMVAAGGDEIPVEAVERIHALLGAPD